MPHAFIRATSCRNPSTICFTMFKLKMFHNYKLVEHAIEMCFIREGLSRVNPISIDLWIGSFCNITSSLVESL